MDVTYTGLFNTEAIKCKHQDIQQGSSLVFLYTEHHVEIGLKLEWFAKDKKHLLNVFFFTTLVKLILNFARSASQQLFDDSLIGIQKLKED